MENKQNRRLVIPSTHFEIFEFITENRQQIIEDWHLLAQILDKLDEMLKETSTMCDLHKDTRIVLETIKIQHDTLLKEIRNELSLERLVQLTETGVLEEFFECVKSESLAMVFVDSLDFECETPPDKPKKEKTAYTEATQEANVVQTEEIVDESAEMNTRLQEIKSKVIQRNRIEFFEMILDLDSYSKTVLNAFDLALAIRMKLVSLKTEENVLYTVGYDSNNSEFNHSVLEITPVQYENLKKRLMGRVK